MSFVLLLLGVVTAAAGIAMIGFGIPINEFSLGNTLIISGMSALAGGFIVIALSVAVRQLTRIADALTGRAAPYAARPAGESHDPTHPGSSRPAGPRVSFPSGPPRTDGPPREPRAPEPRMTAAPIEGDDQSLTEEVPLSPRPPLRPTAQPAEQPAERKGWFPGKRPAAADARRLPPEPRATGAPFDKTWPAELRAPQPSGRTDDQYHEPAPAMRGNGDATRHVASTEPARHEPDEPVSVLKSGVVDGMAYTLYTDGSIEAELAQGVVRFGSIEELRNHLEKSA